MPPIWTPYVDGVPTEAHFGTTAGLGPPLVVDQSSGQVYYLNLSNVPAPIAGGGGGGGSYPPDGSYGDVIVSGGGTNWQIPELDGKVNRIGDTMTGDLSVPNSIYGAAWNGSTAVPTKDSIWDKIESVIASIPIVGNFVLKAGDTMTGDLTVPNEVYGPGWNGVFEVPTKDAVYDKIESVVASIPAAPATVISDVIYGPSWDGVTTIAPSKNTVYDKIESIVSGLPASTVTSFNTRTGAVTLLSADVTTALGFTPANVVHTHVPADILTIPTATVFYRKTAGTGGAETQPLATLKTDLGLTGNNTGDQTITLTGPVTGSGTGSFATTITDNAVTLAKMADVATATVFYRKTAGSGDPEVQLLATLKTDLGLTGTNTGDQTTITGNAGTATALQTARDFSIAGAGITAPVVSFNGTANVVLAGAVDAGHITLARMANVATATVFYRKTAGTGAPEVQTLATLKTDLAISTDIAAVISDTAYAASWNGVTTIAPSKNAVYDQMELQYLRTGGILTGAVTISMASPSLTLNPVSGSSVIDLRGTASTNDGMRLAGSGSTGSILTDDLTIKNRAGSATRVTINATEVNSTVPVKVPDQAYGIGWDGNFEVPTKNAVYDKVQAIVAGGGSLTDGDYGDVVVTLTGAQLTVESATPAGGLFTVTGAQLITDPSAAVVELVSGAVDAEFGVTTGGLATIGTTSAHNFTIMRAGSPLITLGAASVAINSLPLTVVDEAYAPAWDGKLEVPTKNALYDKIQSVISTIPADPTAAIALKVAKAGDTMSGMLSIGLSTAPQLRLLGGGPAIRFRDLADTTTYGEFFINSAGSGIRAGTNGLSIMSVDGLTTYYQMAATTFSIGADTVVAAGKTLSVPDDAYAAGWDGSLVVPTKNAIYDKLQAVIATIPADPTAAIALKVAKAGDTMTGSLTFNAAAQTDRSVKWAGGGSMYMDATGNAATLATTHNFAQIGGGGYISFKPTDVHFGVPIAKFGNSIAAAADAALTLQNTSVYNTISLNSYAPDGSASSADGYIQSARLGPLAISGITGIGFRVANVQYMGLSTVGLNVVGTILSKTATAGDGYIGFQPGNNVVSGYIETFAPGGTRSSYLGYSDSSSSYFVIEGSRGLIQTAGSFEWRRFSDNVTLASLSATGIFQTYQVTAIGGSGNFTAASQVAAVEARSSSGTEGAFMSFHSPGARAMFIGLDTDNVFKMGGWGWTNARFRWSDAGNFFQAGNVIAMENTGQCEIQCGPGAGHGIMYMSNVNAGFYKGGGNHFYVEMAAGGACRHSGPFRSESKMVFRNSNSAFNSAEIFIGSGAPSGGNDGDIWLQYV